jgi:hypothetical protein
LNKVAALSLLLQGENKDTYRPSLSELMVEFLHMEIHEVALLEKDLYICLS